MIYYSIPDDTSTPALIRQSLSTLKRTATTTSVGRASAFPSWAELASGNFAIISNWSSFLDADAAVDIPGCQEQAHLPVLDVCMNLPSNMAVCLIFRTFPNQLAVAVYGTPSKLAGLTDAPFEAKH